MSTVHSFKAVRTGLLALGLLAGLTACTGKEPEFMGDPVGVNRQAKPQISIKDSDPTIDGHLIKYRVTSYKEAKPWLGEMLVLYGTPGAGKPLDHFGYVAAASEVPNPGDVTYPVVHFIEVWLRQENAMGKFVPCDAARQELRRQANVDSIQSIRESAQENGYPEEWVQKRISEVMSRSCEMSARFPENTFKGYLEVDGIPLTGQMSLKEIQARRRQAGLKPLRVDPNSGPPYYRASKAGNDTSWEQEWLFDYPKDKPSHEITDADLLLKRIRVN